MFRLAKAFRWMCAVMLGTLAIADTAAAQTADDVTKLIDRLVDLDSIDLTELGIKYRPGLEPSLAAADADESGMTVLDNPYQVFGQDKPCAAGWYRVSFVVPERLGKFPLDDTPCGIESNVVGGWEIYTYSNGKPAGLGHGLIDQLGFLTRVRQPASAWVKNAPMDAPKAGDRITVAILAHPYPLGRGSPEGYGLRHLRMRIAGGHSASREPFFRELVTIRDKLQTLEGAQLAAFQQKVKGPISRLESLFPLADIGSKTGRQLYGPLSNAMREAAKELAEAQRQ